MKMEDLPTADELHAKDMQDDPEYRRLLEEEQGKERYFADELDGYFADRDGFHDPDKAAQHAIIIQGGFSTPLREAGRMIKDGGAGRVRAMAWLAARGYTEQDAEREQ